MQLKLFPNQIRLYSSIMGLLLLCVLLSFIACGRLRDSNSGEQTDPSLRTSPKTKRVSVVTGSVAVPESYTSAITLSNVDVFGGTIGSSDGSPKIYFITGMNTPWVTSSTRRNYEWVKREQAEAGALLYGSRREGGRQRIEATVAEANFVVQVEDSSDIKRLLEVARSYRPGECSTCETPKREQNEESGDPQQK
jgi:hypothetical protein